MEGVASDVDLERLLRLRVVVARTGEMDLARWWNTTGQLGRLGSAALRRGLPRTHHFAQARAVFAVAAARCNEVYNAAGSFTLWRLPQYIEAQFDARWETWIDAAESWREFFGQVEAIGSPDVVSNLSSFGLATGAATESVKMTDRFVELAATPESSDFVTQLALGFRFATPGKLVVPYARGES